MEIKYHKSELKIWYDSDSELFFGEVKVCLIENDYSIAVNSAEKNVGKMMERLKENYSNYVYGYNMAMAISGGQYRLKYPNEDDNFSGFQE